MSCDVKFWIWSGAYWEDTEHSQTSDKTKVPGGRRKWNICHAHPDGGKEELGSMTFYELLVFVLFFYFYNYPRLNSKMHNYKFWKVGHAIYFYHFNVKKE